MHKFVCISALLLAFSGCNQAASEGEEEAGMPQGYRAVPFSTCCRIPVPFDATATLPGNVIDSEILRIERPGLKVKLEYVRAGEVDGSLIEGTRSTLTIDGAPAVLREFPRQTGGRMFSLSVSPSTRTEASGLGPVLTIRAECANTAECAAARQVIQGIQWLK